MFGSRNFLFAITEAISGTGLWSWGNNSYGGLGLGNTTNYSSPKQVGTLFDWAYPSIGGITNHAVLCNKTDGTLWAWGNGSTGCLGQNNTIRRSSPVQIGALTTWGKPTITGSYAALCIKTDGTLWSWGSGYRGVTAQGNTAERSSPTQVGALTNWSKLAQATNTNMLAVKTDGTLWSWGNNSFGELGLGYAATYPTPGFVITSPKQVGALTDWANPAAGSYFGLCVKTGGTLWSWGRNGNGQLGLGDTVNRSSPTQVGALTNWSKPTGGSQFAGCVKTDGTLWTWGRNQSGQLGHGNITDYSSPKQVGALTNWSYARAGWTPMAAVKTDGTLWAWGLNTTYGQLGLGDVVNRSSPVQVGTSITWGNVTVARTAILCTKQAANSAPSNTSVPVISGTAQEGETLTSTTGTWNNDPYSFAFQWQRGTSDIVGATSSTYTAVTADVGSTLRCVVTATNAKGSASANSANTATVTALTQGQLWNWGSGNQGVLGLNNTTSYYSPKQVGSATNWTYSAMSTSTSFAVNSLGQLWSWGQNTYYGQLGLGDTVRRSSPVQVGALTNWKKVFNDQQVCCAIKTDGTLWAWGRNTQGQLGQGDTTNRSSPVQIGSSTNWVTASVGGAFGGTSAINSLGELWTTGANSFGQLGLNDTTNRSNLTQVPGTDWKNVFSGQSTVHAIKTNGTLWGWGRNNDGVVGNNSTAYVSSPVQIGSDTNWSNVRKASNYSTAAVKTNGTIWAWGNNGSGQLGLGDTIKRSSPVQVGSLTTWVRVTNASTYGCLARKTDGTLWSWGSNNSGALGLGDLNDRSSPVQIGSLTTWVINGFGGSQTGNTSAIKTP